MSSKNRRASAGMLFLTLTVAAVLAASAASRAARADDGAGPEYSSDGNSITRTQWITSKGSNEVIKVQATDRIFARATDPNREIFTVQACSASDRTQCHALVPGREHFTIDELDSAIKHKGSVSTGFQLATPALGLAAGFFKGAIAGGLSSLLGVAVNPYVVAGVALVGVGYFTYRSVKSTVQQGELQAVQDTAFEDQTRDSKVYSVKMTENALREVLKRSQAPQQTSVN